MPYYLLNTYNLLLACVLSVIILQLFQRMNFSNFKYASLIHIIMLFVFSISTTLKLQIMYRAKGRENESTIELYTHTNVIAINVELDKHVFFSLVSSFQEFQLI